MVYANIPQVLLLLLVSISLPATASAKGKIGVAYRLNGDHLLSPAQTVALLRSKGVKRVRSYEATPAVTRAFASSGIDLIIGVRNAEVPGLAAREGAAISWITTNVVPFPMTCISAIIVGNEWLDDPSNNFSLLVPAMRNIYKALATLRVTNSKLRRIKVSTSHSMSVLSRPSFPPSKAKFSKRYVAVMGPLVGFLRKTGSYFMVNIMPYSAYMEDKNLSQEFVLFKGNTGVKVTDPNTGLHYSNLFDLQIDAVYNAIAALSRSSASSLAAASLCAYCNASSRDSDVFGMKPNGSLRVVAGKSGWSSDGTDGSDTPVQGGHNPHAPPKGSPPKGGGSHTPHAPPRGTPPKGGESSHTTLRGASYNHFFSPSKPSIHTWPCSSMHNHVTSTPSSNVMPFVASSSSTVEDKHCLPSAPYAEKIVRSERTAETIANARTFNQNLIRHVLSAKGTPAHPTIPIQAYIFEIFNEDLKPKLGSNRDLKPHLGTKEHFGIFYPNGTSVYPINFNPKV